MTQHAFCNWHPSCLVFVAAVVFVFSQCAQMLMHATAHGSCTVYKSLHWRLTLGEKSPTTLGTQTHVSIVPGFSVRRSTNWAVPCSLLLLCVCKISCWSHSEPPKILQHKLLSCPVSQYNTHHYTLNCLVCATCKSKTPSMKADPSCFMPRVKTCGTCWQKNLSIQPNVGHAHTVLQ